MNSDPLVPGLEITAGRLDRFIERNTALLQRGLALNDQYVKAAEKQEKSEAVARVRGIPGSNCH